MAMLLCSGLSCSRDRSPPGKGGETTRTPGGGDGAPAREVTSPPNEVFFGDGEAIVAAVGDTFGVGVTSVRFDCAPAQQGDLGPAIEKAGEELIVPSFPTPLRSYRAHYRARAVGKTKIALSCGNQDKGRHVSANEVTILDPKDVVPFVRVEVRSEELTRHADALRKAALDCFTSAMARDPHVRGGGSMRIWITGEGEVKIPLDNVTYAGTFYGVPETLVSCVRPAVARAVEGQGRVAVKDGRQQSVDVVMRFEVRPK